jgi:F-type H+-transporting ATPase subunit b
VDTELVAGFQVNVGPWVLHANLRDELKFFSGALRHAG